MAVAMGRLGALGQPSKSWDSPRGPAMGLEEGRHCAARLQPWLIPVEIQPIDPFEVQGDMLREQLSDGLLYPDCRRRLTPWSRATRRYTRLHREHGLPSFNRGRPTPQTPPPGLVVLRRSLARTSKQRPIAARGQRHCGAAGRRSTQRRARNSHVSGTAGAVATPCSPWLVGNRLVHRL